MKQPVMVRHQSHSSTSFGLRIDASQYRGDDGTWVSTREWHAREIRLIYRTLRERGISRSETRDIMWTLISVPSKTVIRTDGWV